VNCSWRWRLPFIWFEEEGGGREQKGVGPPSQGGEGYGHNQFGSFTMDWEVGSGPTRGAAAHGGGSGA
jgi:hypothetical protein